MKRGHEHQHAQGGHAQTHACPAELSFMGSAAKYAIRLAGPVRWQICQIIPEAEHGDQVDRQQNLQGCCHHIVGES